MLGSPRQRRPRRRGAAAPTRTFGLPTLIRRVLPVSLGTLVVLCVTTPDGRADPPKDVTVTEALITKAAFPAKWEHVSSDKKVKLSDVWTLDVSDTPFLICRGKPHGYLRTKAKYKNYILRLEWRYADDDCNSGILVHSSSNGNIIWPASIQIQLHQPTAGSIFPHKGAAINLNAKVAGLKLPAKMWHTCEVKSTNGALTVKINGKPVAAVNGCKPSSGYICLQSEGSEIHFRKMTIEYTVPAKKPAKKKPVDKTKPKKTTKPPSGTPKKKPA